MEPATRRVGELSGRWLTVEEDALLDNAMLALRAKESSVSSIAFWGKLEAGAKDYLVVRTRDALEEEEDFPRQSFFFCGNDAFALQPLPAARPTPAGVDRRAATLEGDASRVIVEDGEETGSDGAFTEADLLRLIVDEISSCTSVVPRGAFIVDPCHRVVPNVNFGGLSAADATDVASYFHFREPKDAAAVRTSDGLVKPDAFLDGIATTHPKAAWSVSTDPSQRTVTLRSLLYPGYCFFHDVGTANFAGVYIGNGAKNHDIAFML